MTNRSVIRISAALLAAFALGCSDTDPMSVAPEDLFVVTPGFIGLEPGSTLQLTATLGGQPASVTWESSDPAVATVSATGLVTVVSTGFTAVTATLVSDPSQRISANINVPKGLANGVATAALSSSAARGSGIYRFIEVPAGRTNLTVTLSGATGDPDLYIRHGTKPTTSSFTCASEGGVGATETCSIANPAAGVWHILIAVWDPYTNAVLRATYTP